MENNQMKQKKIKINWTMFSLAFASGIHIKCFYGLPYLNKQTGEIIWIKNNEPGTELNGADPAVNKANQKQFAKTPHRFLLIEGREYNCDYRLLSLFLDSRLITNEKLREAVKECWQSSINIVLRNFHRYGKLNFGDKMVIDSWYMLVVDDVEGDMETFLGDNEINFEWC